MIKTESEKIYNLAKDTTSKHVDSKVVLVKQFPRYDNSQDDPSSIKRELSVMANSYFDQLWQQNGSPSNIQLVNFELGCESSNHVRKLIFGSPGSKNYDGFKFHGEGASRHFSYRAVQAIKPIILSSNQVSSAIHVPQSIPSQNRLMGNVRRGGFHQTPHPKY